MIFRIKWENIMMIAITITAISCWATFTAVSNIYTLALATITTFMTLIIAMEYNKIRECRHEIIKAWK